MAQLRPGDAVEIDNRGYLAAQTYHRHQVPSPDFSAWDQFATPTDRPSTPNALLLGPLFAAAAAGTVQTGRFEGKMIVVESLLDREALPWQADWYRTKVQEHLGAATDDHFRVWFVDNALHGDDEIQESPTHTISYLGVLHQALRDLSAWVEKGTAPPASTSYEVVDSQVVVPGEARERLGCSRSSRSPPMVTSGPTWRSGTMSPSAPWPRFPTAPGVVLVEWDFDGTGDFPVKEPGWTARRVVVERRHSFSAARHPLRDRASRVPSRR